MRRAAACSNSRRVKGLGNRALAPVPQLGIAADDQDRDAGGLGIGPKALDQLETIHRWHHDIGGHEVWMTGLDRLQAGRTVAGLGHTVARAFENQTHHKPDIRFVIDHENPSQRSSPASVLIRSEPLSKAYCRHLKD